MLSARDGVTTTELQQSEKRGRDSMRATKKRKDVAQRGDESHT